MQPFCKTQALVLFLFMRIQTADDQYTFNESLCLYLWVHSEHCILLYLIYDLFISFNILCFTIINRK